MGTAFPVATTVQLDPLTTTTVNKTELTYYTEKVPCCSWQQPLINKVWIAKLSYLHVWHQMNNHNLLNRLARLKPEVINNGWKRWGQAQLEGVAWGQGWYPGDIFWEGGNYGKSTEITKVGFVKMNYAFFHVVSRATPKGSAPSGPSTLPSESAQKPQCVP